MTDRNDTAEPNTIEAGGLTFTIENDCQPRYVHRSSPDANGFMIVRWVFGHKLGGEIKFYVTYGAVKTVDDLGWSLVHPYVDVYAHEESRPFLTTAEAAASAAAVTFECVEIAGVRWVTARNSGEAVAVTALGDELQVKPDRGKNWRWICLMPGLDFHHSASGITAELVPETEGVEQTRHKAMAAAGAAGRRYRQELAAVALPQLSAAVAKFAETLGGAADGRSR